MIKRQIIHGFTLLELLIVVSLLAVLATVALIANEGVYEQAEVDATKYEMAELRKALLQFRRDVGHFPDAAGLIAESDRLALLSSCQSIDNTKINTTAGVSYDAGCEVWNPDTHRGWNGPYLDNVGADFAFKDAWYDPNKATPTHVYLLKTPGLDSSPQTLWCKEDGTACQATLDAVYYVPDNGARVVSSGPNGADEGDNTTNICEKHDAASDDIVLCLLK